MEFLRKVLDQIAANPVLSDEKGEYWEFSFANGNIVVRDRFGNLPVGVFKDIKYYADYQGSLTREYVSFADVIVTGEYLEKLETVLFVDLSGVPEEKASVKNVFRKIDADRYITENAQVVYMVSTKDFGHVPCDTVEGLYLYGLGCNEQG